MLLAWENFAIVMVVQLLTYLLLSLLFRKGESEQRLTFLVIFMACVPYGITYDKLIGEHFSIFSYVIPYTLFFGALNGALSYGIAAATALLLASRIIRIRLFSMDVCFFIFLAVIAGSVLMLALGSSKPLTLIFLSLFLLGCGELLLQFLGLEGPLSSLMRGTPGPYLRLWGLSLCVGAAYEVAHYWFPVWKWHILNDISFVQQEFLIIVFGYFVLLHSLTLFVYLVQCLVEGGISCARAK